MRAGGNGAHEAGVPCGSPDAFYLTSDSVSFVCRQNPRNDAGGLTQHLERGLLIAQAHGGCRRKRDELQLRLSDPLARYFCGRTCKNARFLWVAMDVHQGSLVAVLVSER